MTLPPFVYKHATTAVISIALVLGAWGAVKWHANTHYNKGVAAEKQAQAERDALVPPIKEDLKKDIENANEKQNEATKEIRSEVRTGISEVYLAKATADAKQTGRELGRAETIAAYRANGSACLNSEFSDGDQLLIDGQDQQRDIFGDVVRGDKAD